MSDDNIKYNEKKQCWEYRFWKDGKDHRKTGFRTKTEAKSAKKKKLIELELESKNGNKPRQVDSKTLTEVYLHFVKYGSGDKQPGTLAKYKSLYKQHFAQAFGDKKLEDISTGELNNYLTSMYQGSGMTCTKDDGYAFAYVESMLKFLFLMYGYAQRMNFVSREKYIEVCEDKSTKLTMPKKRKGESHDVKVFTKSELGAISGLMKNSPLFTSILFGSELGLRISETFAVCWNDVDFANCTISINKQLNYDEENKCFYLATPKTTNSVRVILAPTKLMNYLQGVYQQQQIDKQTYGLHYKATEYVMDRRVWGKEIPLQGLDFVNRRPNGTLLTANSMKSWSIKIKQQLGIDFKYHYLRHTHATELASTNIPLLVLMKRLGHSKIEITQKYYLGKSETADKLMREALEKLPSHQ